MNRYYAALIILSTSLTHPGDGEAENAKMFDALCAAMRAAQAKVTVAVYIGNTANDSLPEPVRTLYAATLDKAANENKTFGIFTNETDFKNLKEHITTAKDKHSRLVYKLAADSQLKRMVNFNLYKIYNDSNKIVAELSSAKQASEDLIKEARQNLAKAISGNKERQTPTKADFDKRENACTEKNAGDAGKSIAADLICICSGKTEAADVCVKDLTVTDYDKDTNAQDDGALRAYTKITAKCHPYEPNIEAEPELLRTTISIFEAKLGNPGYTGGLGKSKHFVLGHGGGTDCSGQAKTSMCVDYTKTVGKGTVAKIPWVAAISEAAAKLKQAAAKRAKIEALRGELKAQVRAAWAAFGLLELQNALQPEHIKPTATQTKQATDTACNKHKDSTTCQPPCKWEDNAADKDKRCSLDPKEAADQATQAAGREDGAAGANTETKKCSEKTTEGECKDGCNWDGKECKDYSFLLNKHFALSMVSAAFVSLLF